MHATQERLTTILHPAPTRLGGAIAGVSLSERELRTRRDLLSRRISREWWTQAIRVLGLVAIDLAAGAFGIWLALLGSSGTSMAQWPHLSAVIGVRLVLGLAAFRAYSGGWIGRRNERVVLAVGVVSLVTYLLGLLDSTGGRLTLPGIAVFFVSTSALIWSGRYAGGVIARKVLPASLFRRRTLLLGERAHAWELLDRIRGSRRSEVEVVGHLVPDPGKDPRALGGFELLGEVIEKYDVRSVIISAKLPTEMLSRLIREAFLHGTSVSVTPPIELGVPRQVTEWDIAGWPALRVELPRGYLIQLALKRIIDVVGSLVGLIFLAPLLLLIAIAIKITSPGPVLFRQVRTGLAGKPFRMFKFRTMVANADELKAELQHLNCTGDPRLFKIKDDPRVTRVGWVLRKTSMDELPQLINVLRGEMSLVGPRPFFPEDLENYEPQHFVRLMARPGITGLWQVSGRSDIVDFEEVVRLDSDYIRNWSILQDIVILFRTIPALFGRGAY